MSIDYDGVISIVKRGWCQHAGRLEDRLCLMAAVVETFRQSSGTYFQRNDEIVAAVVPMAKVILEQWPERYVGTGHAGQIVVYFNDHPATTLDDIIALCEKVRANEVT